MDYPTHIQFTLPSSYTRTLQQYFNPDSKDYTKSLIFNKLTKEHQEDSKVRSSQKYAINDVQSFDLVEELIIKQANSSTKNLIIKMLHNEIELVKYTEGGFFKKHTDFVTHVSNQLKCYALLVCLQSPIQGGETKLYLPDGEQTIGYNEGTCLLFQNEVPHEGMPIIEGTKIVLKVNILCFQKNDKPIEDHLIVRFHDDNRSFILLSSMYAAYPDSVFAKKKSGVITLDTTFEQFQPIYNMLTTKTVIDYTVHKDILSKLGLLTKHVDTIPEIQSVLFAKYEEKLANITKFLNSEEKVMLVRSYDDYTLYKSIFASMESSIVPIQFIMTRNDVKLLNKIDFVSIYDGVPIYHKDNKGIDQYLTGVIQNLGDSDEPNIKISTVRFDMINHYLNSSEYDDEDTPYSTYTNEELTKAMDEYIYMITLMQIYFQYKASRLDYENDSKLEDKIIKRKFNKTIPIKKLIDTVNILEGMDMIKELADANPQEKVAHHDCDIGTYFCNETDYYVHYADICFGFFNIK
jgi:hypothetical protein